MLESEAGRNRMPLKQILAIAAFSIFGAFWALAISPQMPHDTALEAGDALGDWYPVTVSSR